jgi:hypothetical protein
MLLFEAASMDEAKAIVALANPWWKTAASITSFTNGEL